MIDLDSNGIREAEQRIGVSFSDQNLLWTAFTHRSYRNENPRWPLPHNERLEFLGDAVIEIVVTHYLYRTYQNPEGELTAYRSALVNAEMLGRVAQKIGLNDLLLLSRREAENIGKARTFILANAFEALVGAIYLDQGYRVAEEFLMRVLIARMPEVLEQRLYRDSKSDFQDIAQEALGITPMYQVLKEEGPDHKRYYVVGVFLGSRMAGKGKGLSKKEAEREAARVALAREFPHRQ